MKHFRTILISCLLAFGATLAAAQSPYIGPGVKATAFLEYTSAPSGTCTANSLGWYSGNFYGCVGGTWMLFSASPTAGLTPGYISIATGPATVGNSHLDDGVTTAGTVTSSEPIAVNGTSTITGLAVNQGNNVNGPAGIAVTNIGAGTTAGIVFKEYGALWRLQLDRFDSTPTWDITNFAGLAWNQDNDTYGNAGFSYKFSAQSMPATNQLMILNGWTGETGALVNYEINGTTVATVTPTGSFDGSSFSTQSNCASSASPAVCGSAAAGSFVVAASATTVVVDTTEVTANSQIIVTPDSSLGTRLGVTCNTTLLTSDPQVTARTAGTSFTITLGTGPITNPQCFNYWIIN